MHRAQFIVNKTMNPPNENMKRLKIKYDENMMIQYDENMNPPNEVSDCVLTCGQL